MRSNGGASPDHGVPLYLRASGEGPSQPRGGVGESPRQARGEASGVRSLDRRGASLPPNRPLLLNIDYCHIWTHNPRFYSLYYLPTGHCDGTPLQNAEDAMHDAAEQVEETLGAAAREREMRRVQSLLQVILAILTRGNAIFTPFSRHFHAIFTPFSRHFHAVRSILASTRARGSPVPWSKKAPSPAQRRENESISG